jgi:FlaA1/EpsC-like NDP-sugar epimerase
MLSRLVNLSRINKQLFMIFVDAILLIGILLISYSIRLDYWYFPKDDTIRLILVAPIIGIPIFVKLGLYQSVIRYIDLKALWSIVQAVSLYAMLWGLVGFFIQADFVRERGFVVETFPRTVIVINWLLAIFAIGGLRVAARFILSEHIKFSILNYKFNMLTKNKTCSNS